MQLAEDLKKQILIVEDEGLIAADIQQKLERLGYPMPAIAGSGEEALRRARSTAFDLVLMDIRLKGEMDGIATAQALKDELQTPVVYITAHADENTVSRAKLTEPLGYILKPITHGDLRSVVQISLYRHDMERRLRASAAWLSTTLESVGEGILATNTSGELVFMNPIAEQLTGWRGTEALGRLLMDVLGLFEEEPKRQPTEGFKLHPAKNPIFDLLAGESRTYTLVSKTGAQTLVEIECFENRSADELLGAIVVVRDITSRRETEKRLMQSQRMEAVAGVAGGLARDFHDQITVIQGYASTLCERLTGQEKEQAQEIQQAASAAGFLTAQLLTLNHPGEARQEVLNVNEVIGEVQPLITHILGESRTLVTDLGSPSGYIRGDRSQLKQILLNLALNAREAMPAGRELRIESSIADIDAETPAGRRYRPGRYVRLRMADTGQGMDKATLSRIFEPLFTTKKDAAGAGLGLSTVHSIVSQSGGYVGASSEIGQGTTFEILLPCVGTFRGLGASPGSDRSAGDYAAPTVLLVEDEDSVRRLMHKFLERAGYQLLEARNAEDAEDLAKVYEEPIHVLVTDIVMPGMKGPELAERLIPLRPEMKILFVSGYRHDTQEHRGPWNRGLNLLSKPFPPSELVRRVGMLLNQESPLTH